MQTVENVTLAAEVANDFLNPRAKKLLRRLGQGKTDGVIAREIGGTPKQIAAQRHLLAARFGASSPAEFAAIAGRLAPWPIEIAKR